MNHRSKSGGLCLLLTQARCGKVGICLVVKTSIKTPASHFRVPGSDTCSGSDSRLRLMQTLEGSRQWIKWLRCCHLHGRHGLSSWHPASAWPSLSHYRHLRNEPTDRNFWSVSLALKEMNLKKSKE